MSVTNRLARIQSILQPSSVAIAGAAERESSAGGAVLKMLRASGFPGRIVPVNPRGGTMLDLPVSTSLASIDTPCDLAVIAVRPDLILDVVREGVSSGHRNFLILPGGFQEAGAEGAVRDAQMREFAAANDVLIMGPNCAGLINLLDPQQRFAGTFLRDLPYRGVDPGQPAAALISQSGAIAEEAIASSHSLQMPLGCVVSVGNGMHLGLADFAAGAAANPRCNCILFYAESVGDVAAFTNTMREISRTRPVIGLIGGTTQPGAAAAARHTGSKALSDAEADDLCRGAGVLRVRSLRDMLIAAKALTRYPQGIGRRVLILSNSGGPGVLAADQCHREQLDLVALPSLFATEMRKAMPPEAAIANPIDLLADAREDRFGAALELLRQHAGNAFDAVIMIHVVPFMVNASPVIETIAAAAKQASIPIMHTMMGTLAQRQEWFTTLEAAGVPTFNNAEEMAIAAGMLARRADILEEMPASSPSRG